MIGMWSEQPHYIERHGVLLPGEALMSGTEFGKIGAKPHWPHSRVKFSTVIYHTSDHCHVVRDMLKQGDLAIVNIADIPDWAPNARRCLVCP